MPAATIAQCETVVSYYTIICILFKRIVKIDVKFTCNKLIQSYPAYGAGKLLLCYSIFLYSRILSKSGSNSC